MSGSAAAFEFLQELLTVHRLHGVIRENQVRLVVDGFEQRVGAVVQGSDRAELGKRLPQHIQDHRIVVNQQYFDIARHELSMAVARLPVVITALST